MVFLGWTFMLLSAIMVAPHVPWPVARIISLGYLAIAIVLCVLSF